MDARGRGLRVALLVLTLLASTGLPAQASSAAAVNCPGKARWPVKTGADATASQVDVSSVTPMSVAAMRALPAPAKRPQDQRANATERSVYVVEAALVRFRREPDQDIHLMIQDQSGDAMIVEVPDPQCIHGTSPFAAQIAQARATVLARLKVTTTYQPATNIAVRVTGVGFFDMAEHGSGGTPNGIELHPVLKIEFLSAPPSPPPLPTSTGTGAATQLLRDPGFEGASAGNSWRASADVITTSKKGEAHDGSAYAWLGGYGKVHTDTLSQQVTLPSAATRITLSFWIAVFTQEKASHGSFESTEAFDTLTVTVRSSGGATAEVASYSNIDARKAYERAEVDLTAYRGQTIDLVFTSNEDASLQTSFLLDDLAVNTLP